MRLDQITAVDEWIRSIPTAEYRTTVAAPYDPAHGAVALARAGLDEQYAVYERDGIWTFASGSATSVSASTDQLVLRHDGTIWAVPVEGNPLPAVGEVFDALRGRPGRRNAYGWTAFELGHVLHGGDARSAGHGDLVHLMLPRVHVTFVRGEALISAVGEAAATEVTEALSEVGDRQVGGPVEPFRLDTEAVVTTGASACMGAVRDTIEDIRAGLLEKAVLSRPVAVDHDRIDLPATYLAGRAANTPARSFLMDVGGWQVAGFSPEIVLEVQPGGRVVTQPLAGTRAFGQDTEENSRLREETPRRCQGDPRARHLRPSRLRGAPGGLPAGFGRGGGVHGREGTRFRAAPRLPGRRPAQGRPGPLGRSRCPILGAEFVVAASDLAAYADAGHLASAARLVPVPRDSGRRTGNLHRPKRYSRRLRRVFYMSAQTSIIREGPSRDFYLKKRGEGCKHVQAVIALARRRASVLWALLRDGRTFTSAPPVTQAA